MQVRFAGGRATIASGIRDPAIEGPGPQSMSRIIAVANQKGGVGKTTTCVNLAASLAASGQRVLLADIDPQGNATMGCGVDKHRLEATMCELLLGEATARDTIVRVAQGGFDIIPANDGLTVAEVNLINEFGRELRLRRALEPHATDFDYVLVDCPPSLSMLTVNALAAANSVLVPMQCEYYALEGLSALMNTIARIRDAVNPGLVVEGILRTMFDPRNNLANDVSSQLILHFGEQVYATVIPRNVRLAEAPSFGLPVMFYDKGSRGALAYLALADEIMRRDRPAERASA
jgi:chromosome partitioning protein